MTDFRTELEQLINRHNRENGSDTPDFILAKYLSDCLIAFDAATRQRDTWYGYQGLVSRTSIPLDPDTPEASQ